MLIEARRHHKHSYQLIKGTTLPDVTDEERHELACIARYHRCTLPSVSHEEFAALGEAAGARVANLAALVRIPMLWTGAMMGAYCAWLRSKTCAMIVPGRSLCGDVLLPISTLNWNMPMKRLTCLKRCLGGNYNFWFRIRSECTCALSHARV
jgi:Ppx/GppA phosphatase, domain III